MACGEVWGLFAAAAALLLAASAAVGWLLSRRVGGAAAGQRGAQRQLRSVSEWAALVADGEFAAPVDLGENPELECHLRSIGEMLRAMRAFAPLIEFEPMEEPCDIPPQLSDYPPQCPSELLQGPSLVRLDTDSGSPSGVRFSQLHCSPTVENLSNGRVSVPTGSRSGTTGSRSGTTSTLGARMGSGAQRLQLAPTPDSSATARAQTGLHPDWAGTRQRSEATAGGGGSSCGSPEPSRMRTIDDPPNGLPGAVSDPGGSREPSPKGPTPRLVISPELSTVPSSSHPPTVGTGDLRTIPSLHNPLADDLPLPQLTSGSTNPGRRLPGPPGVQGPVLTPTSATGMSDPRTPNRTPGPSGLALCSPRGARRLTRFDSGCVLRRRSASALHARLPQPPAAFHSKDGGCADAQGRMERFVREALGAVERFDGRVLTIGAEEVVALWNTVGASPLHPQRAAQCALRLSRSLRAEHRPQECCIGISTGAVMVGLAGTSTQMAAVATGAPLVRARLLGLLGPVLGARALADDETRTAASSVVNMRVVDTVAFGDGYAGHRWATSLVYEVMEAEIADKGYCAGFAALLDRRPGDAVTGFAEQLRAVPKDAQARRLLRLAVSLRDDPSRRGADGYSRAWQGWEPWDTDGELPAEIEELLQQQGSGASLMSVPHQQGRRSIADDVLLRQQIDDARKAVAVAAEGSAGLPSAFRDQKGCHWHRSGNVLGKGAFGQVWLGICADATMAAIKTMPLPRLQSQTENSRYRRRKTGGDCSGQEVEELLREVALMLELRHENIVSFLGSAVDSDYVLIVMEYCSGGSLQGVLENFGVLPSKTVLRYTRNMLKGLQFLHEKDIIHRDLKPHNVLVVVEGVAKLADFGASAKLTQLVGDNQGGPIGTPLYMAPEAARGAAAKASDIWAVGMIVCILLTTELPWPTLRLEPFIPAAFAMRLAREADFRPVLPEGLESRARDFVARCLLPDPEERPSTQDLLNDVFMLQG